MTQHFKATLHKEIQFSGIGMHTGEHSNLILKPSNKGEIIFIRKDLEGMMIHPDPSLITTRNSSSIVSGEVQVRTIEHLMASLFMMGIDSVDIELDGEEIPIIDGSALKFSEAIRHAGIDDIEEKRKWIRIIQEFSIEINDAVIFMKPGGNFHIDCEIDFDHPAIGRQEIHLALDPETFIKEIAPARTFGLLKNYESFLAQGLARGASLENVIVLDDRSIVNGPLRYEDEFVRHKALDFIGDLSLAGASLLGRFQAVKSSHAAHLHAVRFLLSHPEYYEWTTDPQS